MKGKAKLYLQKLLGLSNYLFICSIFKVLTLRWSSTVNDFIFFLKLLPENGVVLDIGANTGITSIHLCRKVSKGMVYAFEPVPDNYLILQRIIHLFRAKNIYVFRCALGDNNKTMEMVLQDCANEKKINEELRFTIVQRTLDSVAAEIKIPFRAIKIDADNFEYFILKGGVKSFEKFRPIIYCKLREDNRLKCFEIMEQFGYRTMILKSQKLIEFDKYVHKSRGFFFIPINMSITLSDS